MSAISDAAQSALTEGGEGVEGSVGEGGGCIEEERSRFISNSRRSHGMTFSVKPLDMIPG